MKEVKHNNVAADVAGGRALVADAALPKTHSTRDDVRCFVEA